MMLSRQQTEVPEELTKPLTPLRSSENPTDVWGVYKDNMQSCAVCYIRYEALVKAVKTRED